jgi:hypothetical protein
MLLLEHFLDWKLRLVQNGELKNHEDILALKGISDE